MGGREMIRSRMLMTTIMALATLGGPASAADHSKLGYVATLSGPFAMVGEEQQRGLNLAQARRRAGDPLHGR